MPLHRGLVKGLVFENVRMALSSLEPQPLRCVVFSAALVTGRGGENE